MGDEVAVLTTRDVSEHQRSFELRKFFAPDEGNAPYIDRGFNESLNDDGALDAYAETVVWRLRGVHAMVSLLDRGTQYFLAGAVRTTHYGDGEPQDVINTSIWFGCSSLSTKGGLCENTVSIDTSKEEYPCFIVSDLSTDERFRDLPVVNGEIVSYRFYAGTPIISSHGVTIGSMFFFDDIPREDLKYHERKFLHQQARNVMRHLETKREATERKRAALMSNGISEFLEKTSQFRDLNQNSRVDSDDLTPTAAPPVTEGSDGSRDEYVTSQDPQVTDSVLDKIRITLDHAAEIIRESLELTVGGVSFLDAGVAHSDLETIGTLGTSPLELSTYDNTPDESLGRRQTVDGLLRPALTQDNNTGRKLSQGLSRSSADKHKPPKILASSTAKPDTWDPKARAFSYETLASLIKSYPKGNVWCVEEDGFTSSLSLINAWEKSDAQGHKAKRPSLKPEELNKQRSEAVILSQIFPNARQIIFLPVWDASADRWYAGCFVWSQSSVPVFTMESELAYLSAFTNSMMVEISRLDAVTANKMKSGFIGSISHEFRSPLHGILASAEFLRDSLLDNSQAELVSVIQNCSGTLLDTINHVLDYSKINSFEISGKQRGPVSNELYQVTNLALLCEDVVEGMVAANGFRGTSVGDSSISGLTEAEPRGYRRPSQQQQLEIVVDIEDRDWDFKVEAGALRRIVMNLFGNAQKFTQTGYIMVQLRVLEVGNDNLTNRPLQILSLKIRDSGKGMSTEFMERKLYHPFCQEDTFTPGVGLGLSIVWTIVNQLGGKIQVRSEQGHGTDIEVTLAVEKAKHSEHTHTKCSDLIKIPADAEQFITRLRSRAAGLSVNFSRKAANADPTNPREVSWACIETYCRHWFGFDVKQNGGDILISDQEYPEYAEGQRILIIQEDSNPSFGQKRDGLSTISTPIGPFKLARSILALLDHDISDCSSFSGTSFNRSDIGTQTPLGSPEERTILDGIIMTDYGFSAPSTVSSISEPIKVHTPGTKLIVNHEFPTPSRGTDMKLRLPAPRSPQKLKHATAEPSAETSLASSNSSMTSTPKTAALRILAVDDNEINLQLLRRCLLKRKSDTTVTAKNGIQAVDAVKNCNIGERFDVIFMDISMPEMDGFEATRLIRGYERNSLDVSSLSLDGLDIQKLSLGTEPNNPQPGSQINAPAPDTPRKGSVTQAKGIKNPDRAYIVALTGLASRRDRDEAEEIGFDDFFAKPVSFKRIGEVLDRLSREKAGNW